MAKTASAEIKRLSKSDWIDGAILFLSHHSVDSLRLDVLTREFGVTKGSFYWHFTSREDLLDAVLETWRQRHTREIALWLQSEIGTPLGQLKRLLRISISARFDVPGGPLELTLRDWARRDERVKAIIDTVDADRLNMLRDLYARAGLDADQAQAYAMMNMAFVIGGRMMLFELDPASVDRRRLLAERLLIPASIG